MALRSINPVPQYFDASGDVLTGGKMFFFTSGTNDLIDLFFDINGAKEAPNPVILEADGRLPNTFFNGTAKQVLFDKNNQQIWERDPVGGTQSEGAFSDWNSVTVYGIGNKVTGSDGDDYRSLTNENQDNDPANQADPENWEHIGFVSTWNPNVSYNIENIALLDGFLYQSLVNENLNNQPDISVASWKNLSSEVAPVISAAALTFAYRNF